jgi:hypothetical protein
MGASHHVVIEPPVLRSARRRACRVDRPVDVLSSVFSSTSHFQPTIWLRSCATFNQNFLARKKVELQWT